MLIYMKILFFFFKFWRQFVIDRIEETVGKWENSPFLAFSPFHTVCYPLILSQTNPSIYVSDVEVL